MPPARKLRLFATLRMFLASFGSVIVEGLGPEFPAEKT